MRCFATSGEIDMCTYVLFFVNLFSKGEASLEGSELGYC